MLMVTWNRSRNRGSYVIRTTRLTVLGQPVELGEEPAAVEQSVEGSLVLDAALVQDDDAVGDAVLVRLWVTKSAMQPVASVLKRPQLTVPPVGR
ncbi:hypothetical protein [Streptomyces inhibens]|uniref:hypothetical protein n=1 Tax=Streptomyces inhibens TaxID=2293571 RepID=UPI001EE767D0|nr:hypothetical protein [Streptomyces inhibens]UKY47505.1 hypothetical protein KI385_00665 [Streptomyces inhibens]